MLTPDQVKPGDRVRLIQDVVFYVNRTPEDPTVPLEKRERIEGSSFGRKGRIFVVDEVYDNVMVVRNSRATFFDKRLIDGDMSIDYDLAELVGSGQ